ncbi:hypothetical protein KGQ55_01745 [Patescibacteria group bacterium]|nr:hypothetical protein [Patescibacteria group bacterium]
MPGESLGDDVGEEAEKRRDRYDRAVAFEAACHVVERLHAETKRAWCDYVSTKSRVNPGLADAFDGSYWDLEAVAAGGPHQLVRVSGLVADTGRGPLLVCCDLPTPAGAFDFLLPLLGNKGVLRNLSFANFRVPRLVPNIGQVRHRTRLMELVNELRPIKAVAA